MVGLMDFFTGGDPEQMAQIDPRFGVPRSDVRSAAVNALANISATLLAAGQPIAPAQRAQLLSQLGGAASGVNTDLYNASQRRLMGAQMEQRRSELEDTRRLGELMRDPTAFQQATGFPLTQFAGMRPNEVSQVLRQVRTQQLTQDPNQRRLTELQVREAERTAAMPRTIEAGGVIYSYDEGARRFVPQTTPAGRSENERNQALIARGAREPDFLNEPEYAIAFNALYGERQQTLPNGDVMMIRPAVPAGITRPSPRALAAAAGGSSAPGAGTSGEQPPAGAPAAAGGETRTVTTPGGGQVSITSTQPRALSPAEVQLREEAETNLGSLRSAENALRDALRLSPQAYAGPAAGTRGAAAGVLNIDPATAAATRQFSAIMTEQALSQLRAIFGGNPTEGERKILVDMQAGVNMSRVEREALLNRAIEAVQSRQERAERRLQDVVRGDFGRAQPGFTPPAAPTRQTPPPPSGFEAIR